MQGLQRGGDDVLLIDWVSWAKWRNLAEKTERHTQRGGPDIVYAASSLTVYLLVFSTCIIINARKRDFLLVICFQVSMAGLNSNAMEKHKRF